MTETGGPTNDRREGGRYEIRIQGHLDTRWAGWFDGLSLTHDSDGTTVIRGPVVDQAALHGLLQKVRDIGLPLVAVTHVGPNQANRPDVGATPITNRSKKGTGMSTKTAVVTGDNHPHVKRTAR